MFMQRWIQLPCDRAAVSRHNAPELSAVAHRHGCEKDVPLARVSSTRGSARRDTSLKHSLCARHRHGCERGMPIARVSTTRGSAPRDTSLAACTRYVRKTCINHSLCAHTRHVQPGTQRAHATRNGRAFRSCRWTHLTWRPLSMARRTLPHAHELPADIHISRTNLRF